MCGLSSYIHIRNTNKCTSKSLYNLYFFLFYLFILYTFISVFVGTAYMNKIRINALYGTQNLSSYNLLMSGSTNMDLVGVHLFPRYIDQ